MLDESYNANPASVRAMLAVLARTTPSPGGRRLLVLGDMRELGEQADAYHAGLADAVAFGRMFIANPDLPERIRTGAPLNAFDRSSAYGGDAHGYTDYPRLPRNHEVTSA